MEVTRQDVLNNADFCLLIANPTRTCAYHALKDSYVKTSTLHSPVDLIIRLKLIKLGSIFVENTDTSVTQLR